MKELIHFTVYENGTKFQIETYKGEYRNLITLLNDKIYLECFGECGGMGRCATCLTNITGLSENSSLKERNEPVTLSRIGVNDKHIRLSCQLLIINDIENCTIEILENS